MIYTVQLTTSTSDIDALPDGITVAAKFTVAVTSGFADDGLFLMHRSVSAGDNFVSVVTPLTLAVPYKTPGNDGAYRDNTFTVYLPSANDIGQMTALLQSRLETLCRSLKQLDEIGTGSTITITSG